MPPAATHIHALHDPLLGRVLALVGLESGAALTLVCQRWRTVFMSEPALWRTFQLYPGPLPDLPFEQQQQWLESKRRLLAATAGLVTHLEVTGCGEISTHPFPPRGAATGCELARLLRLLRPAVLTDLVLSFMGDCALEGDRQPQPLPRSASRSSAGTAAPAAADIAAACQLAPAPQHKCGPGQPDTAAQPERACPAAAPRACGQHAAADAAHRPGAEERGCTATGAAADPAVSAAEAVFNWAQRARMRGAAARPSALPRPRMVPLRITRVPLQRPAELPRSGAGGG